MRPTNGGDGQTLRATTWSIRRPAAASFCGWDEQWIIVVPRTRPTQHHRNWKSTRPTRCGCGPRKVTDAVDTRPLVARRANRVDEQGRHNDAAHVRTDRPPYTLNVLENCFESGLVVGAPVSATDDDRFVLPLSLPAPWPRRRLCSTCRHIDSGQIRTKRGVVYDFEDPKLQLRTGW